MKYVTSFKQQNIQNSRWNLTSKITIFKYVGVWEKENIYVGLRKRICMSGYEKENIYVGVWEREYVCRGMRKRICMSGCKKENMYVGVWEKEYLYRCEKENIYVTVWERELASKEISLGIQFTGNEKTPMKRVKNQLVATTAIAIPNSSKCFLTSTKCFSTKTSNMSKSTIEAAFFILFCFEIEETNFDFTCYPKICCNILEQHLHILILKPKNKLLRVNSIINNHISCSTFFLVQKLVQKFGKKG